MPASHARGRLERRADRPLEAAEGKRTADGDGRDEADDDFAQMILENLKVAGVQQAHKEDRITFTSLTGWPGHYICAVRTSW